MLKLVEPSWGVRLLEQLNQLALSNYILRYYIPITADIFVFFYPVYLVVFYVWGMVQNNVKYKEYAMYIFFCWVSSVLTNLFIQMFIDKRRPDQLLLTKDDLIFEHIPDAPFPSDHAALSFAIAMSTTLIWIREKNKKLLLLAMIFWLFAIVMWVSRVAAWVHWPTDVLWWLVIWVLVSVLFFTKKIYRFFQKTIFHHLIKLENFIFRTK